jgi:hypothetical protein
VSAEGSHAHLLMCCLLTCRSTSSTDMAIHPFRARVSPLTAWGRSRGGAAATAPRKKWGGRGRLKTPWTTLWRARPTSMGCEPW